MDFVGLSVLLLSRRLQEGNELIKLQLNLKTNGIPVHLPSLRIHQNLTYEPQAEQELCVYQDTLVHPGITFAIVHHFTRSSMYSSTHFIPKHIITYVLIHINTHLHP